MHARASGEAARRAKRGRQPEKKKRDSLSSCLSHLAPSVSLVAICVSRVLLDGLQKKERLLVVYLKADSSFIWKTTTHNRFVVLFTSEFYRVLKRNSSELIAMKHKLNYTVEVGSKLTTLFIFFILRIRERKLVRWLLEVEIFIPCI